MAFTGKSLSDGQVATTWGGIYGPSGVKAIVKSLHFYNTNVATQTLEVRVTRSGSTARQQWRISLAQNESVHLLSDGEVLVLSDGDTIDAQTTTTTAVNYTITGAEE